MCHTAVRGKYMKLVLVPGTAHSLQLILLLGEAVSEPPSVGWGVFVTDVMIFFQFIVQCWMIHEGNIPVLGTRMLASVAKSTLSTA